jgi:hypothetical protein
VKTNLATKHSLVVGLVAVMATASMTIFAVRDATQTKRDALMQHGAEIAEIVANQEADAVYTRDLERLDVSLAGLTSAPLIVYARFLDSDGIPLASRAARDGLILQPRNSWRSSRRDSDDAPLGSRHWSGIA